MNPCVSSGRCFRNDFWVHSDLVFLDYFWVKMDCVCSRIQVSSQEIILVMISESASTKFSLTIYERTGLCALMNPSVNSASSFGDDFWVGGDSVFLEYFWVNRGSVPCRIQASALQAVLVMISESAVTQFSLNIFEWTGVVCTVESKHQLCKQFRWLFLRQQRRSFTWLFLSQQLLCALTNPFVSFGSCFFDDFWIGIDWDFLDYFWVNKGCVRWWICASPLEPVSVRVVCVDESKRQLCKQFSMMIFSASTLFSLNNFE